MDTLERDGFVARGATMADAPAIARVLASAFPRWPAIEIDCSTVEHVEWKMAPPGTPPHHHTVVTEEDRVVCLKLRWIGRAVLDGAEYHTDTGADFAADPAYQGRGLGRLLTDFEINGARPRGDLAMDLPPTNAVVRDHLHASDVRSQRLSEWIRPLRLRAGAGVLRREPTATLTAARRGLRARLRRRSRGREGGIVVRPLERFDNAADDLWALAQHVADFARVRDASYLNWRYADPRSGRRLLLGATVGSELLGWAVLRPTTAAVELIDLLITPTRLDVGDALITAVIRRARALEADSIRAWLPPMSPYRLLLERAGFVRASAQVRYEFFAPRGGTTSPGLVARLGDPTLTTHVTMGDFDFN